MGDRTIPHHTIGQNAKSGYKRMNIILHIQESYRSLSGFRWCIGLDDANANPIFRALVGGPTLPSGENGMVVFRDMPVDLQGGSIEVWGTRDIADSENSKVENTKLVQGDVMFGLVRGESLIFEVSPVLGPSETVTRTSPADKTTVGGNAGFNAGIISGAGTGTVEHDAPTSSAVRTLDGEVIAVKVEFKPR